jgi:hypothetical protein
MKSLTSFLGRIEIRTPVLKNAPPNLGVLDFPALKTLGTLEIDPVASVHTINLPSLESAMRFSFRTLPNLHTINAPKLQSLGNMEFWDLPSLTTAPSFAASLEGHVGIISLQDTGLTDISFPKVETLSIVKLNQNKNLTTLSFPSATLVTGLYARGWSGFISVRENNPNFILSLPKLKRVKGYISIDSLGGIEIPELNAIDKDRSTFGDPLSLSVGAEHNDYHFQCVNCRPNYLTNFSAPKLKYVEGRIAFDSSPKLVNISFPALRSAKEIMINNTAAMKLDKGIFMPSLRRVDNIQIVGIESDCDFFDNLYCRGKVVGHYSCGKADSASEVWNERQFKTWPSFPPSCSGKGVLDLSPPKEISDVTEHLEFPSAVVFEDCYLNMRQFCVHGYMFRKGFLITTGVIGVLMLILWSVMKSWWRRRRYTQENGEKNKVATD